MVNEKRPEPARPRKYRDKDLLKSVLIFVVAPLAFVVFYVARASQTAPSVVEDTGPNPMLEALFPELAEYRGQDLAGADLAERDLSGTDFIGSDLTGADLRDANLKSADLTGAVLVDADLTGANLRGADLTAAELTGVVWSNTVCPDGTNTNGNDSSACDGEHRTP